MSAQKFSPGQIFTWRGDLYEVRQLLVNSQLNIVNMRTGTTQTVTAPQLVEAILVDELQFMTNTETDLSLAQKGSVDLENYSGAQRAVAEYRLEVIGPLLNLPPDARCQAINDRVKQLCKQHQTKARTLNTVISLASVYRWIKSYTQSGGDIRALMPNTTKRGGQQSTQLNLEAEATIKATIDDLYYVRECRSIDYIHREVAVRIKEENQRRPPPEQLKRPSRSTIARRLTSLKIQAVLEAKQGRRATKQQLTQYQATDYPAIPLERVEIDHTRTDLMIIDENDYLPLGRLTLTYGLDTATRYPLGYYIGFEPPSYLTVMASLYHMICPKEGIQARYGTQHDWLAYGIPYTLVVDNGKEFIGRDLDDTCHQLGMMLQQTPVKTPHFKASVERMFGTLNTGLFHTLPGTTFSNPKQRGDYDSLKQSCITLADLDQLLHIFLLDIYAENFHRGLQDIPARRWEKLTQCGFFPRVPASAKELSIFLGRVAYRTIQPYGIDLHSLRYNCSDLTPLRTRMSKRANKQVKVKYNPADLSHIHVYDPDDQYYLEVPALAQEYTQGLSLWKHKVIRNSVLNQQKTVDIVALGRAQRQIQAIVEESLQRKKLSTRTKIARWQNGGQTANVANGKEIIMVEPAMANHDATQTTPPVLDFEFNIDPEKLETEGWSISYDLPETSKGEIDNDH